MESKKMIIVGGGLVGFLILLLVVVYVITKLKPSYYSYEEVEEKMEEASEKYFSKNPGKIPTSDGEYKLEYSTLVNAEVIDPLSELLKDSSNCSAYVTVLKDGTSYSYIPFLNCGDDYSTKKLSDQIINTDNQIVSSGSGLYKVDDEYYFRGKVDNNYVAFGTTTKGKETTNNLWRIISIKNGIITLKSVSPLKTKTKYDDQYNENQNQYVGYNDFDKSKIKEYLTNLREENALLNDEEMSKLVSFNVCIGSRTEDDTTTDGSSECSKLSADKLYFRTILPYEVIRASLDENCKTLSDKSCSNFNYLADLSQESEWTTTVDPSTDYNAYVFEGNVFELNITKSKRSIYPVVELSEYVFYKSGSGTEEDPYIMK